MDTAYMNSLIDARFVEESCSSDTLSMYSITKPLWAGKTEFSDTVLAESPVYGKVLFLDKELQSAESDERMYHEHLVHPIMNAVLPARVLIVGGGEGATAREVLKYPCVKEVHWVDIDGTLVDLCRTHLGWAPNVYDDPRLSFYPMDIRTFLLEMDHTTLFDVVILDLPDPDVNDLLENDYALYGTHFWNMIASNARAIVTHTGPVAPGLDPSNRGGLAWIQKMVGEGHPYHVNIPSFQSEWGFWMSVPPVDENRFPNDLCVMDLDTQRYAFQWPAYWFSPRIGMR